MILSLEGRAEEALCCLPHACVAHVVGNDILPSIMRMDIFSSSIKILDIFANSQNDSALGRLETVRSISRRGEGM